MKKKLSALACLLELIPKPVFERNRAKKPWSRPEVKRARRRTGVRREPFLPITLIHGFCSRLQRKEVLGWVLLIVSSVLSSRGIGEDSNAMSLQLIALEGARQAMLEAQLSEIVTRVDELLADIATNENVSEAVTTSAS